MITIVLKNKKQFIFLLIFLFSFGSILAKEINIGQALEPPHLDPSLGAAGAIDEVVYNNLFEGLVTLNSQGEIVPLLAKKWSISKDKKIYIFDLEKEVYFHDGNQMSAQDVVFSLRRIIAKNSTNSQKKLYESITKVTAINDAKVKIELNNANYNFLYFLSFGDAVIFQEKNYKNNKTKPIGTGPFLFKKWIRGNKIELLRNEKYWNKKPIIDKLNFLFIVDPSTAYYSLLSKKIDGYPNFPAPEKLPLLQKNKDFQVVLGNTEGETLIAMNNKKKTLSNLKVRRAIQHAINKEEIIKVAVYGYAEAIGSHFSPNHPDYIDISNYYPYNLEKAKKLMKEAGYENGFEANLKLPPPFYAKRSGELLVHQLQKIGIRLKVSNLEWATWLEDVFRAKDYDFTIISHTEPYDFFIYARKNYYFNYENILFNSIIEDLKVNFDIQKRKNLHHQLMNILAEDAVNVFLFQLPKLGVWKKEVSGFWKNSPLQANVMKNIQIQKK